MQHYIKHDQLGNVTMLSNKGVRRMAVEQRSNKRAMVIPSLVTLWLVAIGILFMRKGKRQT